MIVRHADEIPTEEVAGATGTYRQVLIGPGEAPNFAMRRFLMDPGGGMPPHTNTVEHEQWVLRGRAQVGIGKEVTEVEPGSVLYIPAGIPHWYKVLGSEPFEFLCMVPNQPDHVEILEDDPKR